MKLRKIKALINEEGLDDFGYSGHTFTVDQLIKDKIYTQADTTYYEERVRNHVFFIDDNGCARDIEEMIKNKKVVEIFD
jgi:hypothetical protein